MMNEDALIVAQALKGARFDKEAIAGALIGPEAYPALTALTTGEILRDDSLFPALTREQMQAALTGAPFPAPAVSAALDLLFPQAAPGVPAGPVFWDFDNANSAGAISASIGRVVNVRLAGTASQTGGGPLEVFQSAGPVLLTRFFGQQFPYIEVRASRSVRLASLSFQHFHNHNPGFSTNPSYSVRIQARPGMGWTDLGPPLLLLPENYGATAFIDLGGFQFGPGTLRLRWFPVGLQRGATDTNTEFFALKNVVLHPSADTAIRWNFPDLLTGGAIAHFTAAEVPPWASAVLGQDGGGTAEITPVDGGVKPAIAFTTRPFGTRYPFIELTLTAPTRLCGLSFIHFHTHDAGTASYPSYSVRLQLDSGGGFADISQPFVVAPENNGANAWLDLEGRELAVGTHRIRWVPRGVASGAKDTGAQFFGIQDPLLTLATAG